VRQRRRCNPEELLYQAEQLIEAIERIVGRLVIIGLASVEGYKYIKWLLEN
jgi:hypothetical protein